MSFEFIRNPQVFLSPITAVAGLQEGLEKYPYIVGYESWTETVATDTTTIDVPGAFVMAEEPEAYIISVGGVVQDPSNYTPQIFGRTIDFNFTLSAGLVINVRQLATSAPSAQEFGLLKTIDLRVTDTLSATNIVTNTLRSLSSITIVDTLSTVNTLSAVSLTATNGRFNNINTTESLLSAGVNLFDLFITSETDSQTLTYNPTTYGLNISNGNNVNLSSINTTVASKSANWEAVYSTVKSTSSNWEAVYSTVKSSSASWEESDLILPTVTNYLSTQTVLIDTLNTSTQLLSSNVDLFDIFVTSNNTLTTSICAMSGDGVTPFVMQFTNGLLTSLTV